MEFSRALISTCVIFTTAIELAYNIPVVNNSLHCYFPSRKYLSSSGTGINLQTNLYERTVTGALKIEQMFVRHHSHIGPS